MRPIASPEAAVEKRAPGGGRALDAQAVEIVRYLEPIAAGVAGIPDLRHRLDAAAGNAAQERQRRHGAHASTRPAPTLSGAHTKCRDVNQIGRASCREK